VVHERHCRNAEQNRSTDLPISGVPKERIMSTQSSVRTGSTRLAVAVAVAAIAIIVSIFWTRRPGPDVEANRILQGQLMMQATGLGRPVENKLAPEFTDANDDGVADAPADPSKTVDPDEITFAYVAASNAAEYEKVFQPLLSHLSNAVGKPVRYLAITDPDEQLRALKDGRLVIGAFNTGAVPLVVNAAGFVPIAALGDEKGQSTTTMKIIAASSSTIRNPSDIAGREIVLTDGTSNTGYKAALALLNSQFGLIPGRDYAIRYSGGHIESIQGLADGTYSIAAVAGDLLDRESKSPQGAIKPDQYRVVFTSDPFPTACFGRVHNLNPAIAAKIEKALLDFNWKDNSVGIYFAPSNQSRLVPVDYKRDFAAVREIDNKMGVIHVIKPLEIDETTTQPQ